MKNVLVAMSDELHAALKQVAVERGVKLVPLIEELLRKSRPVNDARISLGLEWSDRPGIGRPRKEPDDE